MGGRRGRALRCIAVNLLEVGWKGYGIVSLAVVVVTGRGSENRIYRTGDVDNNSFQIEKKTKYVAQRNPPSRNGRPFL